LSTNSENVKICIAKIANAENRYQAEVRIATNTKLDEQRPYREQLAALKQKYEKKMYDLAEDRGLVPCSRWGVPWINSDCDINSLGIILYWHNDDGPDDYFEMSWAEIEKEFGQ
jgi:hypothetical protein